jgi:molybdate transport system regulatory protein
MTGAMAIEATISLRMDASPLVGRERIRLLQAVAREGSISAGARAVGISYKAAWDALDAMANLFGQPLLETRAGGATGGGAQLTQAGVKLIEAFHRMEAEMARVLRLIEPELSGTGLTPLNLMSGFLMKTSARNALRGTITRISRDVLSAEVAVQVSGETTIHASVTMESLKELGLVEGREAVVLIKAPFVMVARDEPGLHVSARNCIAGRVLRCEHSPLQAEVVMDIGDGKTLAASITAASAQAIGLAQGSAVRALFDSSHVILAVD